jgi:hypothetical protein
MQNGAASRPGAKPRQARHHRNERFYVAAVTHQIIVIPGR